MEVAFNLLQGIVAETSTGSWSGYLLYSDPFYRENGSIKTQPFLNKMATKNVIGIAVGIFRMALAIIHAVGHLFVALVTFNKGHVFHAAKGGCEFLKGFIEAIPFIGRAFAHIYYDNGVLWWMIKIYNPEQPDAVDKMRHEWESFREYRPSAYFVG